MWFAFGPKLELIKTNIANQLRKLIAQIRAISMHESILLLFGTCIEFRFRNSNSQNREQKCLCWSRVLRNDIQCNKTVLEQMVVRLEWITSYFTVYQSNWYNFCTIFFSPPNKVIKWSFLNRLMGIDWKLRATCMGGRKHSLCQLQSGR